tara:strand:- start:14309 stop:14728 length:420 start_codon:yes stop_codon:yes gene_type:complete
MKDEIRSALPHSDPFILPDRIIEIDEKGFIHAQKEIHPDDHFLQGHFDNNPVFPGVMLIETMAQSAGVLLNRLNKESKILFLARVQDARFKAPIVPSCVIDIKVNMIKHRNAIWVFDALIELGGRITTLAQITLASGEG